MHMDVPIALVAIGTFVVLIAMAYLGRQFVVARRVGSFECLVWRRSITGREGWQTGLMRYGTHRLRWYRAFSLRPSPDLVIRRSEILDVERSAPVAAHEGMEPHVRIVLHLADGRSHQVLVPQSAAAGMMAWQEAAPAGSMLPGVC